MGLLQVEKVALIRRVLLGIVSIVIAYCLAATMGALIPGRVADLPKGSGVQIGVLRGLIHTDLLLPLNAETREGLAELSAAGVPVEAVGAEWLVVGWGAHDFYRATGTWRDLRAGPVAKAITGDKSVLRIELAGPLPEDLPLDWFEISQDQLAALLSRVETSLARDQAGRIIALGPTEGSNAYWFLAEGRFSILRTCNVWLGETLREGGIAFGIWTPGPWSVSLSLWWFKNG